MIEQIVEEMKAKVLERVPMTLTLEETKEVLDALSQSFVHPGVQNLAVEDETDEQPKGKLPEDFPGFTALDAAGIHTYRQARKQRDSDGLTAVPGIGNATAEKIEEALNHAN